MFATSISACQSSRNYYLHFNDKEAGTFCYSDTTLEKSIDTCFILNDTLFFLLKAPVLTQLNNMEYYYTYRNNRKKYIERLPICKSCSRNDIPYIVLKNYYCIRYFKRNTHTLYYQVFSVDFSSRWINH